MYLYIYIYIIYIYNKTPKNDLYLVRISYLPTKDLNLKKKNVFG